MLALLVVYNEEFLLWKQRTTHSIVLLGVPTKFSADNQAFNNQLKYSYLGILKQVL